MIIRPPRWPYKTATAMFIVVALLMAITGAEAGLWSFGGAAIGFAILFLFSGRTEAVVTQTGIYLPRKKLFFPWQDIHKINVKGRENVIEFWVHRHGLEPRPQEIDLGMTFDVPKQVLSKILLRKDASLEQRA